ncbi:raucaffricine-o-beta-d-glucosidase, partial [Quercus suber]
MFQGDIALMKEIGLDFFRFSISWTRILPSLKPFITLFHWDVPQALEEEYGGFLSQNI